MPYITEQKVDVNYNKLEMGPRSEPQLSDNANLSIYMDSATNLLKYKTNALNVQIADNADVTLKQNKLINVEILDDAKANDITSDQSGSLFLIDSTLNAVPINLPTTTGNNGVHYKFIVFDPSNDITINRTTTGNFTGRINCSIISGTIALSGIPDTGDDSLDGTGNGDSTCAAIFTGNSPTAITLADARVTLTLTQANGLSEGDNIELFCDGVDWYFQANTRTYNCLIGT